MPIEFEICVTDVLGHELDRASLAISMPYMCPTPERERLQDEGRDKAIAIAEAALTDSDYADSEFLRVVVWGKKVRASSGQTTTWRAWEGYRRQDEIRIDWLDQCDYLNLGMRKSGKR